MRLDEGQTPRETKKIEKLIKSLEDQLRVNVETPEEKA